MEKFKLLVIVAIIFMLGACSQSGAVEIGEKAPDFKLADLDGKPVSLSEFSGKVVILNFFATWCPPCRSEIPDFIELQNTYGVQGFSFIGVSLVSPVEAKEYAKEVGINYPVVTDDGKLSADYGPVRSIPTTFVIGKDGMIKKMYIGAKSKEVFENDIKELLK